MFSQETLKNLNAFINKACSIFTTTHQRPLNEQQQVLYFTGFPTHFTTEGVFYKSCGGDKLNFVNSHHLVAICEEEFVKKPITNKLPENISDLENMVANKSS